MAFTKAVVDAKETELSPLRSPSSDGWSPLSPACGAICAASELVSVQRTRASRSVGQRACE